MPCELIWKLIKTPAKATFIAALCALSVERIEMAPKKKRKLRETTITQPKQMVRASDPNLDTYGMQDACQFMRGALSLSLSLYLPLSLGAMA